MELFTTYILASMIGFYAAIFSLYLIAFLFWDNGNEIVSTIFLLALGYLSYLFVTHNQINLSPGNVAIFIASYLAIGIIVSMLKWHLHCRNLGIKFKEKLEDAKIQYSVKFGNQNYHSNEFIVWFNERVNWYHNDTSNSKLESLCYDLRAQATTDRTDSINLTFGSDWYNAYMKLVVPSVGDNIQRLSAWVVYWPFAFIRSFFAEIINKGISNLVKAFGSVYSKISANSFKID